MGKEAVNVWSKGEVRVKDDPQDTGASSECHGGVVENNLGF